MANDKGPRYVAMHRSTRQFKATPYFGDGKWTDDLQQAFTWRTRSLAEGWVPRFLLDAVVLVPVKLCLVPS